MKQLPWAYVSINNVGGQPVDRGIIVTFYGKRGGFRSSESLSAEQAKELRDSLDHAIAELKP